MSVIETFRPHDKKSYSTARGQASNWARKFRVQISEKINDNFYKTKEERLGNMKKALDLQEEIGAKTGLGEAGINEETASDVATLAQNPVLVYQTMLAGALGILFDEIKIEKTGKVKLLKAVPNSINWRLNENLVKALFDNTALSKEMFKHVTDKQKGVIPSVANQVNVSIAK